MIFREATNPVVGKSVSVIEMQNRTVREQQAKPVTGSSHRQRAGLGFQHRHHRCIARIRAAIFRHRKAVPFFHLAIADNPQPAIPAGANALDITAEVTGTVGGGH